ncbi:hypothetical protein PAPYR_5141 [Paratrimastix pyriformis]|uniref:RRM domain-containing protein n=1 Tax=Paratrimastix pyriformis TaxID=342808 RepID=A0ABQ8UP19_9EUKA|nr:hypothetical protein PAPYR_5141 [Paratrimastix pyriformis]
MTTPKNDTATLLATDPCPSLEVSTKHESAQKQRRSKWDVVRLIVRGNTASQFQKPDVQKALQRAEGMRLADQQGQLYPMSTPLEKLDIGIGPLMLLQFSREMVFFYIIICILYLPAWIQDIVMMQANPRTIFSIFSIANFGKSPIHILQGLCDMIVSVAYVFHLMRWRWRLTRLEAGHEYRFIQPSDFSVLVCNLPPNANAASVRALMAQFGEVVHVGVSMDDAELVECMRSIKELRYKVDKLQFLVETSKKPPPRAPKQILDLQASLDREKHKFAELRKRRSLCTGFAFVTYQHECDAVSVRTETRTARFEGRDLDFRRPAEPCDVRWENLQATGKQKFWRRLFTTSVCLFLIIAASLIIASLADPGGLAGPGASLIATLGVQLGTTVIVVIANVSCFITVPKLIRMEKHRTRTREESRATIYLTVFQCLNAVCGACALGIRLTIFSDAWYSTIGQYFLMGLVTDLTIILIGLEFLHPEVIISRKFLAKNDATQRELYRHYEPAELSLSFRYQLLLKFSILTLLVAQAFPYYPIVGVIAFAESYWIDKYNILRKFKRPMQLTSFLARLVNWFILPIGLMLHSGVSIVVIYTREPASLSLWCNVAALCLEAVITVVLWMSHDFRKLSYFLPTTYEKTVHKNNREELSSLLPAPPLRPPPSAPHPHIPATPLLTGPDQTAQPRSSASAPHSSTSSPPATPATPPHSVHNACLMPLPGSPEKAPPQASLLMRPSSSPLIGEVEVVALSPALAPPATAQGTSRRPLGLPPLHPTPGRPPRVPLRDRLATTSIVNSHGPHMGFLTHRVGLESGNPILATAPRVTVSRTGVRTPRAATAGPLRAFSAASTPRVGSAGTNVPALARAVETPSTEGTDSSERTATPQNQSQIVQQNVSEEEAGLNAETALTFRQFEQLTRVETYLPPLTTALMTFAMEAHARGQAIGGPGSSRMGSRGVLFSRQDTSQQGLRTLSSDSSTPLSPNIRQRLNSARATSRAGSAQRRMPRGLTSSQLHLRARAQLMSLIYCPIETLLHLGVTGVDLTGTGVLRLTSTYHAMATSPGTPPFGRAAQSPSKAASDTSPRRVRLTSGLRNQVTAPSPRPGPSATQQAPEDDEAAMIAFPLRSCKSMYCFPVTPTDTLIDLAPTDFGRVVMGSTLAGDLLLSVAQSLSMQLDLQGPGGQQNSAIGLDTGLVSIPEGDDEGQQDSATLGGRDAALAGVTESPAKVRKGISFGDPGGTRRSRLPSLATPGSVGHPTVQRLDLSRLLERGGGGSGDPLSSGRSLSSTQAGSAEPPMAASHTAAESHALAGIIRLRPDVELPGTPSLARRRGDGLAALAVVDHEVTSEEAPFIQTPTGLRLSQVRSEVDSPEPPLPWPDGPAPSLDMPLDGARRSRSPFGEREAGDSRTAAASTVGTDVEEGGPSSPAVSHDVLEALTTHTPPIRRFSRHQPSASGSPREVVSPLPERSPPSPARAAPSSGRHRRRASRPFRASREYPATDDTPPSPSAELRQSRNGSRSTSRRRATGSRAPSSRGPGSRGHRMRSVGQDEEDGASSERDEQLAEHPSQQGLTAKQIAGRRSAAATVPRDRSAGTPPSDEESPAPLDEPRERISGGDTFSEGEPPLRHPRVAPVSGDLTPSPRVGQQPQQRQPPQQQPLRASRLAFSNNPSEEQPAQTTPPQPSTTTPREPSSQLPSPTTERPLGHAWAGGTMGPPGTHVGPRGPSFDEPLAGPRPETAGSVVTVATLHTVSFSTPDGSPPISPAQRPHYPPPAIAQTPTTPTGIHLGAGRVAAAALPVPDGTAPSQQQGSSETPLSGSGSPRPSEGLSSHRTVDEAALPSAPLSDKSPSSTPQYTPSIQPVRTPSRSPPTFAAAAVDSPVPMPSSPALMPLSPPPPRLVDVLSPSQQLPSARPSPRTPSESSSVAPWVVRPPSSARLQKHALAHPVPTESPTAGPLPTARPSIQAPSSATLTSPSLPTTAPLLPPAPQTSRLGSASPPLPHPPGAAPAPAPSPPAPAAQAGRAVVPACAYVPVPANEPRKRPVALRNPRVVPLHQLQMRTPGLSASSSLVLRRSHAQLLAPAPLNQAKSRPLHHATTQPRAEGLRGEEFDEDDDEGDDDYESAARRRAPVLDDGLGMGGSPSAGAAIRVVEDYELVDEPGLITSPGWNQPKQILVRQPAKSRTEKPEGARGGASKRHQPTDAPKAAPSFRR